MASLVALLQRSQQLPSNTTASFSPSTTASPHQRLSTFKTPSSSSAPPPTTTTPSSPLGFFSKDLILSRFLSLSFSFAVLSSSSPASTVEHLHHAIRLLKSQLHSEVLSAAPTSSINFPPSKTLNSPSPPFDLPYLLFNPPFAACDPRFLSPICPSSQKLLSSPICTTPF